MADYKKYFELPSGEAGSSASSPPQDSSATGQISAGFHGELASAIHATKNVIGLFDSAAKKLSEKTGWDITKATKHLQDTLSEYEEAETTRSRRYGDPQNVVQTALRTVGSAPVQMGEYAAAYILTRRPTAAFALVDAAKAIDKGAAATLEAGAIGAATGYALGKTAKLGLAARMPAGAAINAASTALQGGKASDIATGALVGGAFGILPEPGKKASRTMKERIDAVTKGPVEHLDELKKVFAPHLRGPQAKEAALVIREQSAKYDQRIQIAQNRAHAAWDYFSKKDPAFNNAFMSAMDVGGDIKSLPAEVQPFAHTVRGMLDELRDDLVKNDLLKHFYTEYFPHAWKDPRKAKAAFEDMMTRRPLGGSKGFQRGRRYVTVADGLKAGLEPLHQNPIDMVFAKLREGNKALAAKGILDEYEKKGLARKVWLSGKNKGLPKGMSDWKALGRDPSDKTFIIYGPPIRRTSIKLPDGTRVVKKVGTGGINIMGQWYAPEQVANVINNHLAPGLAGNKIYNTVRSVGNVMNQFQLGLSAFHLGFTGIDSMVSNQAVALHYLTRGRPLKALGTSLQTPMAPFRYFIQGNKVLREGLAPGTIGGQMADTVDKIIMGGGRLARDDFYRTRIAQQAKEAFARGDIGRALLRVPFMPVEYMSDIIMAKIVPRMKLGALSQIVDMEMATKGLNATRDEWRETMANAVDSIDNRMGQVIYDNWFMNRAMKDLSLISMRSVGWNVGTFREIVGGVADTRKLLSRNPELSYKLAYVASLPTVIGTMGAMYQVMSGQGWPQETKDYFFPRTGKKDEYGNPERISFPSYMKDLFNYYHDPIGTLGNKAQPLLGSVVEMLHNKDFYGEKIFNRDHPFMIDLLAYAGKQLVPFAARYSYQESQRSTGALGEIGPFFGVTPAARSISQTPAQRLASKLSLAKQPSGGKDAEQADRNRVVRQVESEMRQKRPEAYDDLAAAMGRGEFGKRDVKAIAKAAGSYSLANTVTTLTLDEAMDVWGEATDQEKKEILPVIMKKARSMKGMPPKEIKRLIDRLQHEVFGQAGAVPSPPTGEQRYQKSFEIH